MAYMGWYESINIYLDGFYDPKYLKVYEFYNTLFEYYQCLSYTIYNHESEIYYDVADEDTKNLAAKGARLIRTIRDGTKLSKLSDYEKRCIENIAFTTMAYCHVKGDLDMYDELFGKLIKQYKHFIEDLELNGVDELLPMGNRRFTRRVITYIENENQKVIK